MKDISKEDLEGSYFHKAFSLSWKTARLQQLLVDCKAEPHILQGCNPFCDWQLLFAAVAVAWQDKKGRTMHTGDKCTLGTGCAPS